MYKSVVVGIGVLFYVFFLTHVVCAQEKKENVFLHPDKFYKKYFPHLKINYKPSDSAYIKTYPKNYMTIAVHFLTPKIYADIIPAGASQAASQLRTNVNTITGLSASYRHVTAGFALSLLPPLGDKPNYTHTRYRTATIKYKSPVYVLTFKFMKINGLTDVNGFNALAGNNVNTQRPDISMKEYEFEGIYNFNWKKYSFLSTIDYTEGQIKSKAGFLMKAGIYNQQLYCDTNLLSVAQRPYFKEFDNITKMVGYYIKLAPGIGGNLVFKKHFYASLSAFSPLNLYVNRLYTADDAVVRKETTLQWVLDAAMSIGYQSRRFYAAVHCEVDGRTAKLAVFTYTSVYSYVGIDFGYRFITPKIIKKFYKETMPPGM